MIERTAVLSLLALSLLAAGSAAQDPPPFEGPDVPPDYHLLNWPAGPGWEEGEPYGRTLTGRLTDIPGGDALLMRGDALFLMTSPQYLDAIVPFFSVAPFYPPGASVQDFAIAPGAGSEGRGLVLTVDPTYGLTAHDYQWMGNIFASSVIDNSVAWRRVTRLVSADLDADGDADLIGADGATVHTKINQNGTFVSGWTYVASDPVEDIVVLDYDGDGSPDVAFLTSKIEFYNQAGPPFPSITYPSPQAITKIPRDDAAGDWLALVFRVGSIDYLYLKRHGKMQRAFPLQVPAEDDGPLVNLTVTSLNAGDYNEDADPDLICAQEDFAQNVVFTNQAFNSPDRLFGTGEGEFLRVAFSLDPATAPVPENQGTPAFWTDDEVARNVLVYPLDSLNAVGRTTSPEAVETDPPEAKFSSAPVLNSVNFEPNPPILTVHFTVPLGIDLSVFEYLQFAWWNQPVENGFPIGMAGAHVWFAWPPVQPSERDFRIEIDMSSVSGLDDWGDTGPAFWMMMRFIDGESPGNPVVHKGTQSTISAWRLAPNGADDSPFYADALRNFPWYLREVPFSAGLPGMPDDFGICVTSSRLPTYDATDPLDVPAPVSGEAAAD